MHPRQLLTFSYQPPDNTRHPRQHKTPQDSTRHPQTLPATSRVMSWSVWECLVMSVGVCWCMLVSIICLEHVGLPGVMFWGIKVTFRDNCGALHRYVQRCVWVLNPVEMSLDREITMFWQCCGMQDFVHLTILRHQNIKMSIYKLEENGWVLQFINFLMSVRKKL